VALENYGLFKGWVAECKQAAGERPHYHILARDKKQYFRITVAVASYTYPSELMYLVDEDYSHPLLDKLPDFRYGFTALKKNCQSGALDYIRANLFDFSKLQILPYNVPGPNNDLNEHFDTVILPAIGDNNAEIYVFGERWGPLHDDRDEYFDFRPGNGMHDVHMNQANANEFKSHNGVWQDGAVFMHYPGLKRWIAIFLAFQSQGRHSDDRTGAVINIGGVPEQQIKIIAAKIMVASGSDDCQSVTLLNSSTKAVNLKGWSLVNECGDKFPLSGKLSAGSSQIITLNPQFTLPAQGSILTLQDQHGLKSDGVAYRTSDLTQPGWTIPFTG